MESKEIWKDVHGYEGYYKVSNHGNVINAITGRLMKPTFVNKNKPSRAITIGLCVDGVIKRMSLSRLVYRTFKGDIIGQIDFKDGDKSNCNIENLFDCEMTHVKKRSRNRRVICTDTMKVYESISSLEKHLNMKRNALRSTFIRNKGVYKNYKIID